MLFLALEFVLSIPQYQTGSVAGTMEDGKLLRGKGRKMCWDCDRCDDFAILGNIPHDSHQIDAIIVSISDDFAKCEGG